MRLLYVASLFFKLPDVLRISTYSLSYCRDVVVSLEVTFSQKLKAPEADDGIVTVWYVLPDVLLLSPKYA